MKTRRAMMTINGIVVPSSCVITGSAYQCEACADRLNKTAHPSIKWVVMECIYDLS